jgi:hypothetical protein
MLEKTTASASVLGEGDLSSTLPTRIITYAWGERYIGELLSLTLPALLAPGNLPYVASVTSCELVILTEEAFFSRVLSDPTIRKIRDLCRVRLVELDDLIPAPDKYGMALTYVLHRGFSDLGPSVTDAWLLFLNADFVLADGSLRNVMRHLAEGERLVASPSYCVNAEAVVPELLKRIDPDRRTLSIAHREMAALILRHRHNTIRAKTVNQSFVSMRYMDQFYWLVDYKTLLGHQMPVAIVGMRPERFVAEPNSYWDHGLMKELFPTTEHFVIGDSDEFLMLELRGENVARDQIRTGWPEPSEIARNFTSFLTPYQQGMARYPLTLHAGELPPSVDEARTKLRAFIDSIFTHLPTVLPSHVEHPQWEYHRTGFIEARHKYLSTRLGSMTETSEPPASFSEIDKAWWKLDGLTKSYARRHVELNELAEHQRNTVAATLRQMEQAAKSQRSEIDQQLMLDLKAMESGPHGSRIPVNRVIECSPLDGTSGFPTLAADREEPWMPSIMRNAEEWTSLESQLRRKKEQLKRASDFIDKQHKERLVQLNMEFESAREQLQSQYDRLVKKRVGSATIPHVVIRHGPQTSDARVGDNLLVRLARRIYHACYGKVPRVQPLHPYWAALRYLVALVDAAAETGAANVLVIGSGGVADRVADHLPGTHAYVSLHEVLQGNLGKAFNQPLKFDLCICTLGHSELHQFTEVVQVAAPFIRSAGKIIGFHANFELRPISIHDIESLQGVVDVPWLGRVFYAGSERSARVLQRVLRMQSVGNRGRFARLVRIATMLFLVTPIALAANSSEASASEEQSSRLHEHCTSITIDVTVEHQRPSDAEGGF